MSGRSINRSGRESDRFARGRAGRFRFGFSLIELMVVLVVALVLTSLMLPAMSRVREGMHRIICGSNQRQLGQGLFLYAGDNGDHLPKTAYLDEVADAMTPQELMIAFRGNGTHEWDGIGKLFPLYISAAELFYCPSHHGDHLFDRYREAWQDPGVVPIYTNYHYSGHVDWKTGKPRRLEEGEGLVLLTDGLRTKRDFNHEDGMNALHGDGSVDWIDNATWVRDILPDSAFTFIDPEYNNIWTRIEEGND